jgi:hypothetical protein
LSWRRAPWLLVCLLALPLLVWGTIHSPRGWSRDPLPLGVPANQVLRFSRRLDREKVTILDKDQKTRLIEVFQKEYDRAQNDGRANPALEMSEADQKALIEACHQRIQESARSVLDDRQFALFRTFNQEMLNTTETQVREPAWNRAAPFYYWLIPCYFFILLPLSCVWGCGGLIRDELQADTLGFLTTRPIRRAMLVVILYLCQAGWLEIMALAETLLLFGAGRLREIPALGSLLLLFVGVQFLAVLAWSALGLFLGQVSKWYLALALVYGLIVELGIGAIPTNINSLSLTRHLKTLLSHNAELEGLFQWSGSGVLFPAGILLLAAALFVGLAALLFTFVEYHSTAEMQK